MACALDCLSASPVAWCAACRELERQRPLFALPRGTEVGGLRVGRVLGQGGFGITYLAWDPQLATWRVLKELFPGELVVRNHADGRLVTAASEGMTDAFSHLLARFGDEARTLARLSHPHVVPVTQFVAAFGTAYFAMPFLVGETVAGRHAARMAAVGADRTTVVTLWTVAEVAALLQPLVDALEYLHGQQPPLLHRDIKPDNVYLAADPRAPGGERLILIDFGAAREDLGRSQHTLVFTPGFAAPEQLASRGQGPATDTYAVAATVYFLLSNQRPGWPLGRESLRTVVPNLPTAVADAVMAGLAEAPEHRPSLRELLQAFRSVGGESSTASDQSVMSPRPELPAAPARVEPEKSPRRRVPRRRLAAVAAGMAGVSWLLWPHTPAPTLPGERPTPASLAAPADEGVPPAVAPANAVQTPGAVPKASKAIPPANPSVMVSAAPGTASAQGSRATLSIAEVRMRYEPLLAQGDYRGAATVIRRLAAVEEAGPELAKVRNACVAEYFAANGRGVLDERGEPRQAPDVCRW